MYELLASTRCLGGKRGKEFVRKRVSGQVNPNIYSSKNSHLSFLWRTVATRNRGERKYRERSAPFANVGRTLA